MPGRALPPNLRRPPSRTTTRRPWSVVPELPRETRLSPLDGNVFITDARCGSDEGYVIVCHFLPQVRVHADRAIIATNHLRVLLTARTFCCCAQQEAMKSYTDAEMAGVCPPYMLSVRDSFRATNLACSVLSDL